MTTEDVRGHQIPTDTDAAHLGAILARFSRAVNTIVPVTSRDHADQLVADLRRHDRPAPDGTTLPGYTGPIYVDRADTGALERHTETDGWRIVVPRPVYANLVRTTDVGANIQNATPTTITAWQQASASGITFSGGNVTIPVDGRYEVEFGLAFSSNSTGNRAARVYVNDSLKPALYDLKNGTSGVPTGLSATRKLNLLRGDQLRLEVNQTSGAALMIITGEYPMYFNIDRIGDA